MRVALIGNMNNNLFVLTRYLRDAGYDADLLYPPGSDHFMPWADTLSLDYQEYCRLLDWEQGTFHATSSREIRTVLDSYDRVICSWWAVAFVNKAGRACDLYIPHGSDVYKYAFLKDRWSPADQVRDLVSRARGRGRVAWPEGPIIRHLRDGMRQARHILLPYTNVALEERMQALELEGTRHFHPCPLVYAPEYQPLVEGGALGTTHWADEFRRIRETHDFVVIQHARQEWRRMVNPYLYKGNEKLIRGFAGMVGDRPDVRACLVLLEYGTDVEASKALVAELDIQDRVRWFPKMFRKDIMVGLACADVAAGEFGDEGYLVFGAVAEAMAVECPVLNFREDHLYRADYEWLYPAMPAATTADIRRSLAAHLDDPDAARVAGRESRRWFDEYLVARPLDAIRDILGGAHP